MDVAISVKNLSKSYRMYPSPAERLKEMLHPFGKKYHKEFWALQDVSFELKKGESLGIIGRNGSGKSTLLQLLCGVLLPTEGEVKVNGRISALLELGAGFSPEFTGRDNVYMNGSLMGFTKEEMDKKFPSIAEFADIGEFIDQPAKTYSSGMFVRLAFSCAVNVEPDILIVDEALAVGDMRFQKKCKEKMKDFMERGTAIILVSHSMPDIRTVCQKVVFLKHGKVDFAGDTGEGINAYTYENSKELLKKTLKVEEASSASLPSNYGGDIAATGEVFITGVSCYQKGKEKDIPEIDFGENIVIEFDYTARQRIERPVFRVNFSTPGYKFLASTDSTDTGVTVPFIEGAGKVILEIKKPNLYPQVYTVNIGVLKEGVNAHLFFWNAAGSFLVRPARGRLMSHPHAIVELDSKFVLN